MLYCTDYMGERFDFRAVMFAVLSEAVLIVSYMFRIQQPQTIR